MYGKVKIQDVPRVNNPNNPTKVVKVINLTKKEVRLSVKGEDGGQDCELRFPAGGGMFAEELNTTTEVKVGDWGYRRWLDIGDGFAAGVPVMQEVEPIIPPNPHVPLPQVRGDTLIIVSREVALNNRDRPDLYYVVRKDCLCN